MKPGIHGRLTERDVVYLIAAVLRRHKSIQLDDATCDDREDGGADVILTTDDGKHRQVWVINEDGILETDPPVE